MTNTKFPKRAIVTAGQPNGNKELHIGHISTFIWADCLARFLRDAIGKENVLFVSSTDSYGSMVGEKANELGINETDVVEKFHTLNTKTLKDYNIGLDGFGPNCTEPLKGIHTQTSKEVFQTLLGNGTMKKTSTLNFYDETLGKFLNGRQVIGRCPISACKSEEAYADECALGHQYAPSELIAPISKLSGTRPSLKETSNYYFDLPSNREYLLELANNWEKQGARESLIKEMRSFLEKPKIFINKDFQAEYGEVMGFDKLADREAMCDKLRASGVRFRTGKTLTPFRITGNSEWGIPVPTSDSLTFYCWPESLWMPISSTKAIVPNWQDFWCDHDSEIYQVIGEDNIYFYTHAAISIFKSLDWGIRIPQIISNKHTLISGAKAASSGKKKAPTARDLLNAYTPEQIKMYFLGQNVPTVTAEFRSKAFFPETCHANEEDPFLREGNILTNIFNRIARSVFYTTQKYFNNVIPNGEPTKIAKDNAIKVLNQFEHNMLKFDLNKNIILLDEYFREANKNWSAVMKEACKVDDIPAITQTIIDAILVIKAGIMMLHCIVPSHCELIADMLNISRDIFEWTEKDLVISGKKSNVSKITELEPQFDFFKKKS